MDQWLNMPKEERYYATGALLLLKLSGNQVIYKNIIAQIDSCHDLWSINSKNITTSEFRL